MCCNCDSCLDGSCDYLDYEDKELQSLEDSMPPKTINKEQIIFKLKSIQDEANYQPTSNDTINTYINRINKLIKYLEE